MMYKYKTAKKSITFLSSAGCATITATGPLWGKYSNTPSAPSPSFSSSTTPSTSHNPMCPTLFPAATTVRSARGRIRTERIRSGTTRLTSAGRSTSSFPASNPSCVAGAVASSTAAEEARREVASEENRVVRGFGGDCGVAGEVGAPASEELLGARPRERRERRRTTGLVERGCGGCRLDRFGDGVRKEAESSAASRRREARVASLRQMFSSRRRSYSVSPAPGGGAMSAQGCMVILAEAFGGRRRQGAEDACSERSGQGKLFSIFGRGGTGWREVLRREEKGWRETGSDS
jgi:hypothetical protein